MSGSGAPSKLRSVAVASTSAIKVQAVTRAVQRAAELVPDLVASDVTVSGVKAASGVSEQPVGHEETRRGARNRCAAAQEALAADLTIAIENGIVEVLPGTWVDLAWVVASVRNPEGGSASGSGSGESQLTSEAHGTGVPIGATEAAGIASAAAAAASADTPTWGDLMAEKHGASTKDPHDSLTCGLLPRAVSLEAPLLASIGSLLFQMRGMATSDSPSTAT